MVLLEVVGAAVAGVFFLGFILFKLMWRVAEPNEALVISGLREHTPSDTVSVRGFREAEGTIKAFVITNEASKQQVIEHPPFEMEALPKHLRFLLQRIVIRDLPCHARVTGDKTEDGETADERESQEDV